MRKYKPYIISVLIALAVGGLSAFVTKDYMDIYDEITRPPLVPPGFIFPIVWTVLYTLMGIGSAIMYTKCRETECNDTWGVIYILQLVVNFFWSIIYFRMRSFFFAFIWLLLLIGLVIWMIIEFRKISKTAAYLQIPYLIWILFAAFLNFMTFILN